ncbi:MAG: signal peptidase I [Treponemataceae bacterium]|jgi:signal peptidase I|nr:signal peptidase I [Treponemataceae bacterium]
MKSGKRNIFIYLAIGIVTGVFLRIFIINVEKVSGTSMEPSIKEGETVIVNKLAYGIANPATGKLIVQWAKPEINDIIVYYMNDKLVMKRCVGVENMPLDFSKDSEYSFQVGGIEIPLTEQQYQRLKYNTSVPEGTVLAIGDNYEESVDSRIYGFIETDCILGKVIWH